MHSTAALNRLTTIPTAAEAVFKLLHYIYSYLWLPMFECYQFKHRHSIIDVVFTLSHDEQEGLWT